MSQQFLLIPLQIQLSILKTVVGKCAMSIFGSCCQWRNEHFKPEMLLFSWGNDTVNAPRYWQQRHNELLCDVGKGATNSYVAIFWQFVSK
jgi:hypothetical protein